RDGRSYLAFKVGPCGAALEAGDRGGRIEALRAKLLARLVRVAGVAAAGSRDRLQTLGVCAVANVVDERPRAIERRRPEIARIPAHGIAGGVAYAAIDAFDGGVGGDARGTVRPDAFDFVVARPRGHERALRPLPLVEEGPHVGGQILDDGQILEWPNLKPAVLHDTRQVRTAGPARPPVHGHGAGAAHAHAAGKAVRQRRGKKALNERHHVEQRPGFAPRGLVTLLSALLPAPPEAHGRGGTVV